MAEVSLSINGKNYGMECDDGQEARVADLGGYVDHKLQEIASAGAANSETHLLVLTSLMLADEILELKTMVANSNQQGVQEGQACSTEDEQVIVQAIDHLAGRIEGIAERIQKA